MLFIYSFFIRAVNYFFVMNTYGHKWTLTFDLFLISVISLSCSQEIKVGVCGSQVVGLVPIEAMLKAADYYIEKENLFVMDEDQKIKLVSHLH